MVLGYFVLENFRIVHSIVGVFSLALRTNQPPPTPRKHMQYTTEKSSPQKTYWAIQLIGWTTYALFGFAIQVIFAGLNLDYAIISISGAAFLMGCTHLLRKLSKHKKWESLSFGKLILRVVGVTLTIATISQLFVSAVMIWGLEIFKGTEFSFQILGVYVFQTEIILLLWSALYYGALYFRNYKQAEIDKWRLEAIAKDAEITSLKSQINPHFIFNSLNNIRALILEDSEKARDMLTRLSELLQYVLHYSQQNTVTIEREIEVVNDYLSLESIQLEERLQYSFDIAPETRNIKIPPMTIQLLAENGIKHGISRLPQGGSIHIKTQQAGTALHVQVTNSGQLAKAVKDSTSVGLKNLQSRLTHSSGPGSTLNLKDIDSETVSALLVIPNPRS